MRMPMNPVEIVAPSIYYPLKKAFMQKALQPEFYSCRVWMVYGTNCVTVVPEPILIYRNAHIFSGIKAGDYDLNNRENPDDKRLQVMFDLLQEEVKHIVTMVEVLEEQWVARCSAWHMGFTDETPWHTHTDGLMLAWELIDTYGVPENVDTARPANIAG